MPNHDGVRVHRVERLDGVAQGFALAGAGGRAADVDDVGAKPLAGQLERRARARRRLVEDVDDGLAAKVAELDDGLTRQFQKLVRLVEQVVRQLERQAFDGREVGEPRGHEGCVYTTGANSAN